MILILLLVIGMIISFIGYLHLQSESDNDIVISAWTIFMIVYVCNLILKMAGIRG